MAAPIGSGLGIQNPVNIRLIVEQSQVPVIVDAGVGTASDATIAMELGCDGVLMNTAFAEAKNPILMARAMRLAVESGRLAYRAGRMPRKKLRRSVVASGGADLGRFPDLAESSSRARHARGDPGLPGLLHPFRGSQ